MSGNILLLRRSLGQKKIASASNPVKTWPFVIPYSLSWSVSFNFTHLDSADCRFFTDNKVAARTDLPQMWDKPVRSRMEAFHEHFSDRTLNG